MVDSTHRMSENLLEILEALKYVFLFVIFLDLLEYEWRGLDFLNYICRVSKCGMTFKFIH